MGMTKDQIVEAIERAIESEVLPIDVIAQVIIDINRIADAAEQMASPHIGLDHTFLNERFVG